MIEPNTKRIDHPPNGWPSTQWVTLTTRRCAPNLCEQLDTSTVSGHLILAVWLYLRMVSYLLHFTKARMVLITTPCINTWHDMTWHDMTLDRKCMHYAHLHIYCASVLSLDGRWSSLGKTSSGSHSVRITSTCTMGGMDRPTNTMQRYAKIDNIFYMFTKRKKIDLQKKSKDISRYPNGLWSIPYFTNVHQMLLTLSDCAPCGCASASSASLTPLDQGWNVGP